MDPALERTLADLPAEPGCYLMKDRAGAVVYVGKAASLRSRVRQYFDAGAATTGSSSRCSRGSSATSR